MHASTEDTAWAPYTRKMSEMNYIFINCSTGSILSLLILTAPHAYFYSAVISLAIKHHNKSIT